ncbi:MAG TPA: hypothetical protein VI423_03075 [Paenisporosarcina sp.]|nr:hypothetical protein [Paenisporosarcina sp.]
MIINILSNVGRLESIKAKLSNFATTVWDISEDDYIFLYEQAERVEELESTITVLDNDFQKDIMNKERIAYGYKKQRDSLKEENAMLREALENIIEVDEDYLQGDVDEMRSIATKALEASK